MTRGLKQFVFSTAIFLAVLAGLVSVDDRVREQFTAVVFGGGNGLTPWGDRIGDLGDALIGAIRHQSIENAPLLVFTAVGAVLVVFMVKS